MTQAEEVVALTAELGIIQNTLTQLAAYVDVSEGGRSLSAASSRSSLTERQKYINERLAQLSGPFAITSTGST